MDSQERSALLTVLLEIQQELRSLREERKEHQTVNVHLKQPRVSLDTVVISVACSLLALGGFWACVSPVVQR